MSLRRRNATRLAMLMFLLPMLASSPLSQAAVGDHARNTPSHNPQAGVSSNDVVPGIVVVKLKHSNSVADGPVVQGADPLSSAFANRGVTSLARAFPLAVSVSDADVTKGKVDLSQIHFATIPSAMNPMEVAARLADLPQVEYAEPKYYSYTCDVPNDSDYLAMQQVYFDRMNVSAGWTLQKGNPDVVIATVDGGTNWQHEDLKQNMWVNPIEDMNHNGVFDQFPAPAGDLNGDDDDGDGFVDDVVGWNFADSTNNPRGHLAGSADHGTKTASVFGAVTNNGRGMAGTSWNCRIMAVCAADPYEDNRILFGFEGIAYAAAKGARVINCSWVRPNSPKVFSQMEQDVITAATQAGALIVAAAGNSRQNVDDVPYYPAAYHHVLSVGATMDTSDAIAPFTNYGLNVSVFAPGERIRVALNNGSYGTDAGTSMSSPLVAGLAGLLVAAHPGWKPEQIAEQIRMTADPIDGTNPTLAGSLAHGRVNFGRALSEDHSGVVVVAGGFHAPSGRTLFLGGDTVTLSVKVKNVLTVPAQNLSFNVSADPALVPLAPVFGPTHLDAGAEDSLEVAFRVDDHAQGQDAYVRLGWSANADEWDARMFKATVYARTGFWERQESPTTLPLYSVHAVSRSIVWAAGVRGSTLPVVVRTTDGGDNWIIVTGDLTNVETNVTPYCIFAIDSLHAWVGDAAGRIFATVNGGLSWTWQEYPSPHSLFMDGFWFFDAANGYALGDPGDPGRFVVLRTTDGGTTWTHLANEPVGEAGVYGLVESFCCTDRQHAWFGASNSLVWRTTDGGDTWLSATAGSGIVPGLAMRDDSVGIACSVVPVSGETPLFARTTDGGATWQMLPGVISEGWYKAAFPAGSANAWVSAGRIVVSSRDSGVNWVLQPTDPFSGDLMSISFSDPANGWIVTTQGEILRYRDLSEPTSVRLADEGEFPAQTQLLQNYPNPFNPSTTIKFELQKSSEVRLTVFDVLGREVSVLVNERRDAGVHDVKFDASGLSSGVYFYRLIVRPLDSAIGRGSRSGAGDFVQTRKLLVLR